jgi:RNA polymerase sigma-70 factor (ECF subfamily)
LLTPTPAPAIAPEHELRRAFEATFEAEFDYVWVSLRRLGIPERDVEDVTHDTFMTVYKHFRSYDPARPIRPWLFAFACRVASDYRRLGRNAREQLTADGDAPEDLSQMAHNIESDVARREEAKLVEQAIAYIHEERRPVFILAELEEQPVPVIAEALGIPLNTAYSRLRLAREDFRNAARRLQASHEKRGVAS